jgi:hypothetical protein
MELLKYKTRWIIYKFKDPTGEIYDKLRNGAPISEFNPIGVETVEGNVVLNEGKIAILQMITGTFTGQPWSSTSAYIGVGDSSIPEDSSQTGLFGTNKYYKSMDSGYPQVDTANFKAIWRATFGPTEANFTWNEFTVVNSNSDAGINLNRKVENKGTKQSGETWTLEIQLALQ